MCERERCLAFSITIKHVSCYLVTYEQLESWLLLKTGEKKIWIEVASCLNLVVLGSRGSA